MDKLPQMASVSDIRHRHLDVFERAEDGPVVVSSRGKPVAVVLSPALWDKIVEQIDDLDDLVVALEAELAIERGEEQVFDADIDELKAWATGNAIPT